MGNIDGPTADLPQSSGDPRAIAANVADEMLKAARRQAARELLAAADTVEPFCTRDADRLRAAAAVVVGDDV